MATREEVVQAALQQIRRAFITIRQEMPGSSVIKMGGTRLEVSSPNGRVVLQFNVVDADVEPGLTVKKFVRNIGDSSHRLQGSTRFIGNQNFLIIIKRELPYLKTSDQSPYPLM